MTEKQSIERGHTMNLLTIKEVAAMLRITRMSLHKYTIDGALPTIKFGKNVRYKLEDVESFIQKHITQHQTQKGKHHEPQHV